MTSHLTPTKTGHAADGKAKEVYLECVCILANALSTCQRKWHQTTMYGCQTSVPLAPWAVLDVSPSPAKTNLCSNASRNWVSQMVTRVKHEFLSRPLNYAILNPSWYAIVISPQSSYNINIYYQMHPLIKVVTKCNTMQIR